MKVSERAPAKVNLVLRVGAPRPDGLHPVCSIFASLELADRLTVEEAEEDSVRCPGVEGENLASGAVTAFRGAVPELPPLKVTIEKGIPVAAGMGGGSADAAAVLRAANELSGARLPAEELRRLGAGIGSDVPSQIEPCHSLVTGFGERIEPIGLPDMAFVLVAQEKGLSTPDVFKELDRLREGAPGEPPGRPPDPEPLRGPATSPFAELAAGLDPAPLRRLAASPLAELAGALENDLQPAAMSLRPELGDVVERLLRAGALTALLTGSGPTAFGVFPDPATATCAAATLEGAIVTETRPC